MATERISRNRWSLIRISLVFALALLLAGCGGAASGGSDQQAQADKPKASESEAFIANAPGACNDPWINSAYNEAFGRTPNGSGNTGECNVDFYGAGSWTSYTDLVTRVRMSKKCGDPWIGQIIYYTYNREPRGLPPRSGECNVYLYGGSWSSYMDLANKVKITQFRLSNAERYIDSAGNLRSSWTNGIIYTSNQAYIDLANSSNYVTGSGNVVAAGAGNVVAVGGGNVVAVGGGNIVAVGGGN